MTPLTCIPHRVHVLADYYQCIVSHLILVVSERAIPYEEFLRGFIPAHTQTQPLSVVAVQRTLEEGYSTLSCIHIASYFTSAIQTVILLQYPHVLLCLH